MADDGDMVSFDTLLYYIDNNDISTSVGYNYVINEVDILSLSTIYIAEMFVLNQDWPGNNIKLWRPKDNSRKWEWCLVITIFCTLYKHLEDFIHGGKRNRGKN